MPSQEATETHSDFAPPQQPDQAPDPHNRDEIDDMLDWMLSPGGRPVKSSARATVLASPSAPATFCVQF